MAQDDLDDTFHSPTERSSDVTQESGELAAENASLRDRLLRSLADAENARRRSKRSVTDARDYAISSFAAELLGVVDNLQSAIAAAEQEGREIPRDAALLDGVRATQRQLLKLARFGVRPIDALGASFDPRLHEAMAEVDDESASPRSVVRVFEDGYSIHDRLLRAARVIVAKPRLEAAAQVDAESGR
jgi:molecular chaperone GrpE